MTATLLPNAKQQFIDGNGIPLEGGKVYFYVPNTSTPKNTWQDAGQTILNTNPVILDASGEAIIYGTGEYRQVVYDINNNLIWDALTQDVTALLQSSVSIYCGTSTGTPNNQILTPTPTITSLVPGQQLSFFAGFSNTGPMTLAVSALGPFPLLHGGAALPGNSVIAGAATVVQFNATGTAFELVNPWELPIPGPSGHLLESNGTIWTSAAPKLPPPGGAGNILESDGTQWVSTPFSLPNPTIQFHVFTTSGTFTAPAATINTTVFKFTIVGAGGGGGGSFANTAGAGGGAGAACIAFVSSLTASTGYTVTIGAAGTGGASGTGGTTGGTSSVVIGATTYSAAGGVGGTATLANGGNGGTASNGTINISGGAGAPAVALPTVSSGVGIGGQGGASIFGGGGSGGNIAVSGNGGAGLAYGSGGGGGAYGGLSGGNGAPAIVIVEWILS